MGDTRIIELIEFAYREGVDLPMPAAEILAIEDQGHTVDLVTGEVIEAGAGDRIELTVIGQATGVVMGLEAEAFL